MNKRCATFWKRGCRGLTLVEAAAGAALLGTLLTMVVLANARLTAQAHAAQMRIEGCRLAEELLQGWASPQEGLVKGSGEIEDHPGWSWRCEKSANDSAKAIDAQAVWLRVFAPGAKVDSPPTAQVELLMPGDTDEKP